MRKYFLNSVENKVVETLCVSQSTEKTFDMKKYLREYMW